MNARCCAQICQDQQSLSNPGSHNLVDSSVFFRTRVDLCDQECGLSLSYPSPACGSFKFPKEGIHAVKLPLPTPGHWAIRNEVFLFQSCGSLMTQPWAHDLSKSHFFTCKGGALESPPTGLSGLNLMTMVIIANIGELCTSASSCARALSAPSQLIFLTTP
jgi:hypothetical protein